MQWKTPSSPRPKNPSMTKSQIKTMLITFFDARSIVYLEFIPQGEAINQADYIEILTILHVAVLRKRPELCAQQLVPPSRRRSSSPSAVCQSRYNSTIYCWTGTYPLFIRSCSQLILALYRIITHLDGTNISTLKRSEKCVVSAEDHS